MEQHSYSDFPRIMMSHCYVSKNKLSARERERERERDCVDCGEQILFF